MRVIKILFDTVMENLSETCTIVFISMPAWPHLCHQLLQTYSNALNTAGLLN